jgi:hypothetical protein
LKSNLWYALYIDFGGFFGEIFFTKCNSGKKCRSVLQKLKLQFGQNVCQLLSTTQNLVPHTHLVFSLYWFLKSEGCQGCACVENMKNMYSPLSGKKSFCKVRIEKKPLLCQPIETYTASVYIDQVWRVPELMWRSIGALRLVLRFYSPIPLINLCHVASNLL